MMDLLSLLEEFWVWTALSPEKWWQTDLCCIAADPVLFPKSGAICNVCMELINKDLSSDEIFLFLMGLAINSEDEDILDQLRETGSDAFIVSLLSAGINHPQSEARWQLAELLRRNIPNRMIYLNQLLQDPDEYVRRRARWVLQDIEDHT
jgi:hypothetical protein